MRETKIRVTLFEENSLLKEWEQDFPLNLPALLQAVKHIKVSLNEHFSHLISQHRDFVARGQGELSEPSDLEDEVKDDISGFIKRVSGTHEKTAQREKRGKKYLNQAKKIRK